LGLCGFHLLEILQALNFMGIRFLCCRRAGESLSFLQQKESNQRNAAPLNTSFYLKSKIKVPSSLPIFVAAAELTN